MKHIYETHTDCRTPYCPVCDGGLAICTVCGLIEGSLTTDCPGQESWKQCGDAVYAGLIDFRNGEWVDVQSPYCPPSRTDPSLGTPRTTMTEKKE